MRLHSAITINGVKHPAGSELSWTKVYPFFLVHILMFGASGFFLAYESEDISLAFLYLHGGIAIAVYTAFYLAIFGRDEVRWMYINAALGIYGVMAQIDWLLGAFGKTTVDFPVYVHLIPFLYYVLYTFLLRQMVLDLTGARDDEDKRHRTDWFYIAGSLVTYSAIHLL